MFITAPIWPWARRLIQMKKAMMSTTGRKKMIVPHQSDDAGL
ncbi:MAG: hypothetical protein KatS3mg009_1395 [Acidimicrobiia bacterium]|nr:MAG: hypothetical protein KatS3mg009_1395 [Acidimicrobiia bacterium]